MLYYYCHDTVMCCEAECAHKSTVTWSVVVLNFSFARIMSDFTGNDCSFMQAANAEVERVDRRGANVIFYFQSVSLNNKHF